MQLTPEQKAISDFLDEIISRIVSINDKDIWNPNLSCWVAPIGNLQININGSVKSTQVQIKLETNRQEFIEDDSVKCYEKAEYYNPNINTGNNLVN